MMRLDDSRQARLLDYSTQYASLETSMQMSELDLPMFRRSKSWSRCYAISACIALISVAAIVSGITVRGGKKFGHDDPSKDHHVRREHRKLAPAPSPVQNSDIGDGWTSSFPAPTVEALSKPVSSALLSPESSPTPSSSLFLSSSPLPVGPAPLPLLDPSVYRQIYDQSHYEIICNKTIDRDVCLDMLASEPNSDKVDLQQWTIMSMEAAEHALNQSLVLAQGLKPQNPENAVLQQCINVFGDALDLVNSSMYIVADMDIDNPGKAGTDAQRSMTAAITNQDTCQEGIDEVGAFPGSEQISGDQAKHVDTMLSIALTFIKHLTTLTVDPNSRRRLMQNTSAEEGRPVLSRREFTPS